MRWRLRNHLQIHHRAGHLSSCSSPRLIQNHVNVKNNHCSKVRTYIIVPETENVRLNTFSFIDQCRVLGKPQTANDECSLVSNPWKPQVCFNKTCNFIGLFDVWSLSCLAHFFLFVGNFCFRARHYNWSGGPNRDTFCSNSSRRVTLRVTSSMGPYSCRMWPIHVPQSSRMWDYVGLNVD